MSFDHWWYSCLLTPEQENELEPLFMAAQSKAVLSAEHEEALRSWESHGERFDMTRPEERFELAQRYNSFVWAFNLPGYDELGETATNYLNDEACARFISLGRCSPGAVLWQSLGRARAERLPGRMGNLFVRAGEVDAALKQADLAMAGLDMEAAIARGMELAGHSNAVGAVTEVITHLQDGLRDASARKQGFMAVARPQM